MTPIKHHQVLAFILITLFLLSCNNESKKIQQVNTSVKVSSEELEESEIISIYSVFEPPLFDQSFGLLTKTQGFIDIAQQDLSKLQSNNEAYFSLSENGLHWDHYRFTLADHQLRYLTKVNGKMLGLSNPADAASAEHSKILISEDINHWQVTEVESVLVSAIQYRQQLYLYGLNGSIYRGSIELNEWESVSGGSGGHLYAATEFQKNLYLFGDTHQVLIDSLGDWVATPAIDLGLPNGLRAAVATDNVIIVSDDQDIYYTNDGTIWKKAEIDFIPISISVDNNYIYASTVDDIYYTSTDGVNWTMITTIDYLAGGVDCTKKTCLVLGHKIMTIQ